MDKIGIPRSIFYYYDKNIIETFLRQLKISYIVSPKTNKEIFERGIKISNDEMCTSLKIYLGHIDYLKDKCDYIFVPRICSLDKKSSVCTNFMSIYDIVGTLENVKTIHYNLDYNKHETLKKGLYKLGKTLKRNNFEIKNAYKKAIFSYKQDKLRKININKNNLNSNKIKILLVAHPYNLYDDLISGNIIKYLNENDVQIIYSDRFNSKKASRLSEKISRDLYFKFSKENLGSIVLCDDKIDGIIFISTFPCGPDSLVTEITERSINIPNINLIMDGNNSFEGVETRLESFLDVLKERKK